MITEKKYRIRKGTISGHKNRIFDVHILVGETVYLFDCEIPKKEMKQDDILNMCHELILNIQTNPKNIENYIYGANETDLEYYDSEEKFEDDNYFKFSGTMLLVEYQSIYEKTIAKEHQIFTDVDIFVKYCQKHKIKVRFNTIHSDNNGCVLVMVLESFKNEILDSYKIVSTKSPKLAKIDCINENFEKISKSLIN